MQNKFFNKIESIYPKIELVINEKFNFTDPLDSWHILLGLKFLLNRIVIYTASSALSEPKLKKTKTKIHPPPPPPLLHRKKKILYFKKWNGTSLPQKYFLKHFYTLHKPTFGETWTLNNLYYLLAAQAFSFEIHHPFSNIAKPQLVTYTSLCCTCVTYRTPCHSIGHQVLRNQTLLGKPRISFGMESILRTCLCPYF